LFVDFFGWNPHLDEEVGNAVAAGKVVNAARSGSSTLVAFHANFSTLD
jgi:hypothetical protein